MSKARNLANAANKYVTTVLCLDGQYIFRPNGNYLIANVDVFWNGTKLVNGIDFQATDGNNIIFSVPTSKDDVVEIVSYGSLPSEISPMVFSVSGYINENSNTTLTLTGTNFKSGATVQFINYTTGSLIRSSPTVIVSSNSTLTATTGNNASTMTSGTRITIRVINPSGLYYDLRDVLVVEADPIWSTASGNIGTFYDKYNAITNIQLTAAASTGSVSYAITNNQLPTGLSLSSAGVISGIPAQVSNVTTTTFDVTAYTDGQAVSSTPRTFNIIINPSADGSTSVRAASSATAIKTMTGTTTNGYYYVNINGTPRNIYCDMSTDGGGWMLVYELTDSRRLSGTDSNSEFNFAVNNSAWFTSSYTLFSRVAYYQQNNMANGATSYYAWASMDKWSGLNPTTVLPPSKDRLYTHQTNTTNLNVISNYNQNWVTDTTGSSGRVEIWPYNYGTARGIADETGDSSIYDENDTINTSGYYGCVQVFNMNAAASNSIQCVMAWNNHAAGYIPNVGFGKNISGNPHYSSIGHADWTFSDNGAYNFKHQGWIK